MSGVDAPVAITSIVIHGNDRTKQSYFADEFADVIQSRSVQELYDNTTATTSRLRGTGLFEALETNIKLSLHNAHTYEAYLDVHVKEVGVPFLKVESYVRTGGTGPGSSSFSSSSSSSKGDVGCQVQGALRNPLGHGEIARLSYGRSSSGGKESFVDFRMPNVSESKGLLQITAKKTEENPSFFVGFKQLFHTIEAEYSTRDGAHTTALEVAVRDELPVLHPTTSHASAASQEILAAVSSSTKTAIKYIYTQDTRDVPANPTSGSQLRSIVELALPTGVGAAQYLKTEIQAQTHKSVPVSSLAEWIQSIIRDVSGGSDGSTLHRNDSDRRSNSNMNNYSNSSGSDSRGKVVASLSASFGVLWPLLYPTIYTTTTDTTSTTTTTEGDSGVSEGESSGRQWWSGSRLSVGKGFQAFLSDRYYGGGPMALRGFATYGIGPRAAMTNTSNSSGTSTSVSTGTGSSDDTRQAAAGLSIPYFQDSNRPGNALGGISKFSLLGMLSAPVNITALGPDGARAFIFFNAGSIGMAHQRQQLTAEGLKSVNMPFFGHLRASVGVGLALTVGPAVRVEMTYAVPVLKANHDVTKSFQLGVGLSIS